MSDRVHVSVIVPAHNEEKYVKRCIAEAYRLIQRHLLGKEIYLSSDRRPLVIEEVVK